MSTGASGGNAGADGAATLRLSCSSGSRKGADHGITRASPAEIRRAIIEAAPNAIEIGDRREAIATAIAELGAGDLLVIAGKGHETGQIIGTATYPFDDAAIARELARNARPSSYRRAG